MESNDNDNKLSNRRRMLESLDGFNQHLCETSDALLNCVSIFHSFLPSLIPLSNSMNQVFDGEHKCEEIRSSTVNPTERYIQICRSLSDLIFNSVIHVVGDSFTTSQIVEIRGLFSWFLDIVKSYHEFYPKSVYLPPNVTEVKLSEKFQQKLDKQYSKIVLELANNLQQEPTDLHTLNILPSSFPHHVVAFSQLLCRIIDVQQHLLLSEASYKSENERNSIIMKYPTSKMLLKNPNFFSLIGLQNELLNMVRVEKRNLNRLFTKMEKSKKELCETRERLAQTIQTDFIDLREANISLLEELVQLETTFRSYKSVKKFRDQYKKFEIDISFDKEVEFADQVLKNGSNSEYFSDITQKQVLALKSIKDRILATTTACRHHLDDQNKRIRELSIPADFRMNDHDLRRNDLYQFRQIIDSIRKSGTTSLAAFSKYAVFEEAANLIPAVCEKASSKNAVLSNSAYLPSIENIDSIDNSLKSLIEDKSNAAAETLRTIGGLRDTIDKMNTTLQNVKNKIDHPESSCLKCETERDYVLLSCGHTFCRDCFAKFKLNSRNKCPFCKMSYSKDDISQIEWEF